MIEIINVNYVMYTPPVYIIKIIVFPIESIKIKNRLESIVKLKLTYANNIR